MNLKKLSVVTATSLLLIAGCTPKLGGDDYDVKDAGRINQAHKGIIVALRKVTIHGKDASNLNEGGALGGVAGAVGGASVGQGRGNVAAAGAAGLLGIAIGQALGQQLTKQDGVEYQVQLQNGSFIVIVQGEEPKLAVGQSVLVIEGTGGARSRVVADWGMAPVTPKPQQERK